jgi:hypothetical protein
MVAVQVGSVASCGEVSCVVARFLVWWSVLNRMFVAGGGDRQGETGGQQRLTNTFVRVEVKAAKAVPMAVKASSPAAEGAAGEPLGIEQQQQQQQQQQHYWKLLGQTNTEYLTAEPRYI